MGSLSERKSEAKTSSWEALVAFHQELLKLKPAPDALKIRRLADAKGVSVPTWFLGCLRASEKLSSKHPLGHQFIASTSAAEMASRKDVAEIRFRLINQPQAGSAFFPACGAGLDLAHFSAMHPNAVIVFSDIDLEHLRMAQWNMGILHHKKAPLPLQHDAKHYPFKSNFDYTFIDPARRQGGQKFGLGEMEPSLEDSLNLSQTSEVFQIKLPAGFSPENHLPDELQSEQWQWDWIQFGRDVVECVGTKQPSPLYTRGAHFYDPVSGVCESWTSQGIRQLGDYGSLEVKEGSLVVMPEPVLKTSGVIHDWSSRHDLRGTAWPEIFLSNKNESLPLSKTFKVMGRYRPSMKELKKKHPNFTQHKFEPLSRSERFPLDLQKSLEAHNRKTPESCPTQSLLFLSQGNKKEVMILERI